MKRSGFFMALSALIFIFFVGCGANNEKVVTTNDKNPIAQSTAKEPDKTTDKKDGSNGKIKVAVDFSYRPMEYIENNEMKGFSLDLMKAIAKKNGKEVEFTNVKWDDIFNKLYSGKYDIAISSITINEERKKTLLFSDPYLESKGLVLFKNDKKISGIKDLTGKKVAAQTDTTTLEILQKNIPGVAIAKESSMEDVFKRYEEGKADYVVSDSPVILDYIKTHKDKGLESVGDAQFYKPEFYGIAAEKRNQKIIEEINKGLADIKQSGEYQKIYSKYFGEVTGDGKPAS